VEFFDDNPKVLYPRVSAIFAEVKRGVEEIVFG